MKKNVILFMIATIVFLLIDLLWLGVLSKDLYQEQLGHLISNEFKLVPAVIFYVAFVTGLLVLVLKPGLKEKSFKQTILYALIYGFATYGAYDLTNYATMQDFPLLIVVIDLIWGTSLTLVTTVITYVVYRRFFEK